MVVDIRKNRVVLHWFVIILVERVVSWMFLACEKMVHLALILRGNFFGAVLPLLKPGTILSSRKKITFRSAEGT